MNIIDVQDKLKGLPEDALLKEMQSPTGMAPQFLVLGEITRRKRMRDSYQAQAQQPQTTVVQDVISSAGVSPGGIADMAQQLAPNSSIAQNGAAMGQPSMPPQDMGGMPQEMPQGMPQGMPMGQPPVGMAEGGYVQRMADGGFQSNPLMSDPAIIAMANRQGMSVQQYLDALGAEGVQRLLADKERRTQFGRMMAMEPMGEGSLMPTQADLDAKARQPQRDIFPTEGMFGPPTLGLSVAPRMAGPDVFDATTPSLPGSLPGVSAIPAPPMAIPPSDPESLGPRPFRSSNTDILSPQNDGFFDRGDEFRLGVDPMSGAISREPTFGTGIRRAVRGMAEADPVGGIESLLGSAAKMVGENVRVSEDPRSLLTDEERAAILSGALPPEEANAILADRAMEMGQTTGSMLSGAGAGLLPPQGGTDAPLQPPAPPLPPVDPPEAPLADQPPAPPPPAAPPPALDPALPSGIAAMTGGSPAAGGGIASLEPKAGSYEATLSEALDRAARRAEQDKWLALAQTGLALMASKAPTLGGAIGEAGAAGLQSYRDSRDAYEQQRMGLEKAMFEVEMLRQKQAAAAAAAAAPRGMSVSPTDLYDGELKAIYGQMNQIAEMDDFGQLIFKVPRTPDSERLYMQLAKRAEALAGIRFGTNEPADMTQ